MGNLERDMRACASGYDGTGHIAQKYLMRGADRIAELERRLEALVAGSILPTDAVDEFTADGVRWVRVPAERQVKFI